MVINLIKKDLKDSSKYFVPLLTLTILVSIAAFIPEIFFYSNQNSVPRIFQLSEYVDIFAILTLLLAIISIVLGVAIAFRVLYTNVYGNKGYELSTLPVSTWKILISKVVSFAIWILIIYFTLNLSFLLINYALGKDLEALYIIGNPFENAVLAFDLFVAYFNQFLLIIVFSLLLLFAGSIVNSSFVTNKRGIIMAIILIAVLLINSQVEGLIFLNIIEPTRLKYVSLSVLENAPMDYSITYLYISLSRVVVSVVLFFGTTYLLKNKLQLSN